jgi:hypothetical protein
LGRNTVYLPPKYFDEIRGLPNNVVSFNAANDANMEAEYTGIAATEEEMHHSIQLVRGDLTQSIGRVSISYPLGILLIPDKLI